MLFPILNASDNRITVADIAVIFTHIHGDKGTVPKTIAPYCVIVN